MGLVNLSQQLVRVILLGFWGAWDDGTAGHVRYISV